MKKILVTGAAGFIGFHLAKQLHARNDTVFGYDNFNSYYTPKLKEMRADSLKKLGISVARLDILDLDFLKKFIEENGITHIAHLAAQAGVRYSLDHPQEYAKTNISGFLNILEACKQFPHLKLTYASSSSVYGLNSKIPFSTEDQTDAQASFYGVTKKANELMAATYHHLYKIPVTGLRFFTVYGPWGRPDMAYFSFAKAINEGRPIELFNYGEMERDFTYIDDIVAGTIAAIDLGAPCEIFNLGNHQPVKLLKFVEILENALGKKAKTILKPIQPGDVVSTFADIEKSQKKLGFYPRTSLEEGISHFAKWYRSYTEHISKIAF
ncbi:MAG TPA: GDP-mannose 4,6-dehydratase [Parachlamydiaceae bacterium]|nr:GDP-mannose 4,6-dehydratase [Parachlamydiaceae bacterium]